MMAVLKAASQANPYSSFIFSHNVKFIAFWEDHERALSKLVSSEGQLPLQSPTLKTRETKLLQN